MHKRATIIRTTKTITQKMVNFIAGFNNRWQQLEQQSNDIYYIIILCLGSFLLKTINQTDIIMKQYR